MRRKCLVAALLLVAVIFTFAGCNYVGRPIGVANNATGTSANLANLLKQPVKTVIDKTTTKTTTIIDPAPDVPEEKPQEDDQKGKNDDEPKVEPEPEKETPKSPFAITTKEVFDKIQTVLKKVQADLVDAKSATGVSDALMGGRTVYVYMPYDVSGKDDAMMKSVASKLNMTVVLNNLNAEGVNFSAQMLRIHKSGTTADLMFVDQNIWGDIQYYTQPISSFVNFELGDKLNSFRSSMSGNYMISDGNYKSEESARDYYVASGIGAPYLLAYNKANLKSTGTLPEEDYCKAVTLADPAQMFKDQTWGLKAMQKMLIQSTVDKCVGLATIKEMKYNVDCWFGCDNVPAFKLDMYSKAAKLAEEDDNYSVAGASVQTLDTIQELYWTNKGANEQYVATFFTPDLKSRAISKLFNTYVGKDSITKYAMLSAEVEDLPALYAAAGNANWDFVGFPYGTMTENKIRSQEPDENGKFWEESGLDTLEMHTAGWASGFAVMDRCRNPAIALRFAEDYTVAWRENYESGFMGLLSDAQKARYEEMKAQMGVTFYRSMYSHATEMNDAYPGASGKTSSVQLSAMAEFTGAPELYTQLIFDKDQPIATYSARSYPTWSSYFTPERVDGMGAAYQLARVMFNY